DGLFVAPYALARRNFIQLYAADVRLGDIEIERYQGGLDMGISGSIGELRIGPYINAVTSKPGLGAINPAFSTEEDNQKGIELRVIIDQMDDPVFPRSGVLANLDIRKVDHNGDPDLERYTRAQAVLDGAVSFGDNTLRAHLEWGDEISGQSYMPVFETFSLGGPLRLSGLYLDQLTGYDYDLATLSYYHRYASLLPQIGRGIYVGLSAESGRIDDPLMTKPNEWINSGSIFWGADTILGALYLGYGRSFSPDQSSFYLVIGPQF
ncbi:MAG: BamA/TamA family outer membrane protein, partial [Chromatiales bacterium]